MDITEFATLTPMKYYNNEDTSNAKRQDMKIQPILNVKQ